MASIKKNLAYSTILTISGYLFPLITFPYVTRVLGVNNIGICNFVDSIVQYFIFFSMMGMVTVGIREIARAKDNKEELSRTFSGLITINLIATVLAIVILLLCTLCVPQLREYKFMFYIGAAKILANTLLMEWLFKGLEEFKYITIRTVLIKSIYVVLVFLLVRQSNDYIIYFALTTGMVVVNAIVNLVYGRNFVTFKISGLYMQPYIKPLLIMGAYQLLTSMYTTFNVAYLGFATDTVEVGYYSTATKLYALIMSFFSAFTGVMMPRMSSLISEGRIDEFKKLTSKSVEALFAFAFPLIIICEVCAPQIIQIIAGSGYEGAIVPMRIVMPLMLVIGYEQVLILQILSPLQKDAAILKNSIFGAVAALLLNIALVSRFASIGSSIVWIICEVVVLISAQYHVTKYIGYKMPVWSFIKRISILPVIFICTLIIKNIGNDFIAIILTGIIAMPVCIMAELLLFKNSLLKENILHLTSLLKAKAWKKD